MYIFMPTSPSIIGLIEISVALPKTAEEARQYVADRNAVARRTREESDRAHEQRQAELKEGTRRAQAKTAASSTSWSRAVKAVNRERKSGLNGFGIERRRNANHARGGGR